MTLDVDGKTNLTRDFTEYKYKVFTNLDLLLNADLSNTKIYDSVCAKECPNFNEDDFTSLVTKGLKIENL